MLQSAPVRRARSSTGILPVGATGVSPVVTSGILVSWRTPIDYYTSMQIAVEWLVALCFLIIGLSHVFQPRAWVDFFIGFREKGSAGSLQLGLLHLPLALLIVSFHNVWQGWPLAVTLIGWSQLLKGFLYLTFPRHGLRMLAYISTEKSWRFVVGGIFAIALSLLIAIPLVLR